MTKEAITQLLVISLLFNLVLCLWLAWRIKRHRSCRLTLERVRLEREAHRKAAIAADARALGVSGGLGPVPSIERLTA